MGQLGAGNTHPKLGRRARAKDRRCKTVSISGGQGNAKRARVTTTMWHEANARSHHYHWHNKTSATKPYSRLLVTDEAFISPTFSVNAVFLYTSTPPDREHHAIYRRRRRLPRFFIIFDFFSPPPSTLSRHGKPLLPSIF